MLLGKVKLIADQLWMYNENKKKTYFGELKSDDKDLIMFTIISVDLLPRSKGEGVEMRIILKRKATMELMTTFLPTLLLLLLSFSVHFFKVDLFGEAMALNLTIMLVMTTIFTSKIEELPPTSDLKMVDYWLIFCQLIPFTQMVMLTAKDYFGESVKRERENANRNESTKKTNQSKAKGNWSKMYGREGPGSRIPTLANVARPVTYINCDVAAHEENKSDLIVETREVKSLHERVVEGLKVTGDPMVPTPPRDLRPPRTHLRPHQRLHCDRRVLLSEHKLVICSLCFKFNIFEQ